MQGHDMTTIVHPINLLVSDEYDRAAKLHGAVFASPHEGYGVLAEEVQEAGDEADLIDAVMRQLLLAIREEKPSSIVDLAECIRDKAVSAAAERVQVAAMCEKMVRTVREGK